MYRLPQAAGRKGTMAKEICISSTPHETRLAILEDDQLAEIYYERENEYTLAGSIYNGRVTRVLPGMQSAFVDLGLERDAFLYVTDFIELEDQEETDELERAAATGQAPREIQHPHGIAQSAPQGVDRNGGRREERGGRPRRQKTGVQTGTPRAGRDAGGDGCSGVHRVLLRRQGRRRNTKKRAEVAGGDGVAAAADADRALHRKGRLRRSQALRGRPSRFETLKLKKSRRRAKSMPRDLRSTDIRRRRPLCCRVNRFRSMAARRQARHLTQRQNRLLRRAGVLRQSLLR